MSCSGFLKASALLAALLGASIACKASQTEGEECVKLTSSQQVFECSKINKKNADDNLNRQYGSLLDRIKKQYRSDPGAGKDFIDKIKKSQRAWMVLRDSNCEVESHEIEIGTLAYDVTNNNCIFRESVQRVEYLKIISPDI